jgi:membrane fusion protein (multidrug efflux system)
MAKARFWSIFAAVAVAALAGLWFYAHKGDRMVLPVSQIAPADGVPTRSAGPAVAVEASVVRVQTVTEDLQAVGTLLPDEAVTIAPEIAGRVEKIGFREGGKVAAGAVLVELDTSILRAELAKIRSELRLARANHERSVTLAREGMAALRTRDETLAALQTAEADLALAEARLEKATIRAPLSGVVGLRSVSVGAYVSPGQAIVELADIDPIKLDFRVPELALPELRTGQPVRASVDALPGRTFEGTIYAIDPIVEVGGRAVRLRARIPNPEGALSPGLFARVDLVIGQRENAVVVPESAVFASGGQRFVYRIVDDRAVLTEVALGLRAPGQVEVLEGLGANDVVVSAGQERLRDGVRVEVLSGGDGESGGGAAATPAREAAAANATAAP